MIHLQKRPLLLSLLLGLAWSLPAVSLEAAEPPGDWSQFLGPTRNGISAETGLLETWPAGGVKPVWRAKGGIGMSAVVVSAGKAVTMIQDEDSQLVIALDAKTGNY